MQKQVLIADDEPVIARRLRAELEPKGLEVITANSGREAVEAFDTNLGIRLVLLARNFPDASGLEVLHAIRETPRIAKVWFVTPAADSCVVAALLNSGADAVLAKPLDISILVEMVLETVEPPTKVLTLPG